MLSTLLTNDTSSVAAGVRDLLLYWLSHGHQVLYSLLVLHGLQAEFVVLGLKLEQVVPLVKEVNVGVAEG